MYHVLNRGVGRMRLFDKARDYETAEEILGERDGGERGTVALIDQSKRRCLTSRTVRSPTNCRAPTTGTSQPESPRYLYGYDQQGRQHLHISVEGVVTEHVYSDTTGRLIEKRFFQDLAQYDNGAGTANEVRTYTHNAFGRVIHMAASLRDAAPASEMPDHVAASPTTGSAAWPAPPTARPTLPSGSPGTPTTPWAA